LEISPSIASLIQPGVITIESEATVSEAAIAMAQKSVRNIFVTKKGEPVGLLRDWDIITRVVAFNSNPDMVRVDEIMYTPAPTVTTDAELPQIAALMAESGVRRVLVREGNRILGTITAGRLLGIVSSFPKTPLRELYRKIQLEV
jgi:CBS domain-containing protein